jgi:hypothetical protein
MRKTGKKLAYYVLPRFVVLTIRKFPNKVPKESSTSLVHMRIKCVTYPAFFDDVVECTDNLFHRYCMTQLFRSSLEKHGHPYH